jgi:hypothetical protein
MICSKDIQLLQPGDALVVPHHQHPEPLYVVGGHGKHVHGVLHAISLGEEIRLEEECVGADSDECVMVTYRCRTAIVASNEYAGPVVLKEMATAGDAVPKHLLEQPHPADDSAV